MHPSRLAVILLLGVLPLSAAGQCCIPSLLKLPPASHCSHSDHEPKPPTCNASDEAVFERVPLGLALENHLWTGVADLPAKAGDSLPTNSASTLELEYDAWPPADLAFLRHSPLLI